MSNKLKLRFSNKLSKEFGLETILITSLWLFITPIKAWSGTFLFAENNGVDIITHPTGYTGSGGTVTVGICVDADSQNAAAMEIPLRNIAKVFTDRVATTGNLLFGATNNIPSSQVDFESVALHEVGHCLGMAHPNLASESGLSGANRDFTKTRRGSNNTYNIDSGTDAVIGSSDDSRGDDVNLYWFWKGVNDPFAMAGVVDATTYSRDVVDLPVSDNFVANGNRDVGALLGYANSEAVMTQGTSSDEAQRDLSPDDVATLELAMSGLDETAGTADDYNLIVEYQGSFADPANTSGCDIIVDYDDSETGFAVCQVSGTSLSATHLVITAASIYLNSGFNWFFNDILLTEPNCQITNLVINSTQSFTGCTDLKVGPDLVVSATGQASFSASSSIRFEPGFQVALGGRMTASVAP